MGKFEAMHKCFAVLLALLACNGSLLTYGRKIKPFNQNSSLINTRTDPTLPLFHGSSVHFPPTPTSPKNPESLMVQNYDTKTNLENSSAHNSNAFRPTTPGGSPGVGHPKDFMAVQSQVVKVSAITSDVSMHDFRPTDPGNSPGVGHAQHNKIEN